MGNYRAGLVVSEICLVGLALGCSVRVQGGDGSLDPAEGGQPGAGNGQAQDPTEPEGADAGTNDATVGSSDPSVVVPMEAGCSQADGTSASDGGIPTTEYAFFRVANFSEHPALDFCMRPHDPTESLPFEAGEHKRAAVKIIDDRGIESLKIVALE